ncbi:MarR family winged helix-turn-helix transcriptional regulator [Hyphomicrobium sp. 99]|uniref:MarR family winged helix-turn-helix transcriptional regulator n=1 Tax=Hyphomicrobium sp. 99 TaxID=1163419 RepID=UPI0005F78E57|nr:MarR family winged helix-turn-helix transcriptional regulator [Hyphomicrobium sp. 99]
MTRDCNNAMLRRASRMLGQIYDDALTPSGLRATQHGMLAQIAIMGDPTLRDLATEIVMDLSALGHTLKPLIRDGYLALVPDKKDRRIKHVTLTKAGRKKLEQTTKLWLEAQRRFEKTFGEQRAADLRAVLEELSSEQFRTSFIAIR